MLSILCLHLLFLIRVHPFNLRSSASYFLHCRVSGLAAVAQIVVTFRFTGKIGKRLPFGMTGCRNFYADRLDAAALAPHLRPSAAILLASGATSVEWQSDCLLAERGGTFLMARTASNDFPRRGTMRKVILGLAIALVACGPARLRVGRRGRRPGRRPADRPKHEAERPAERLPRRREVSEWRRLADGHGDQPEQKAIAEQIARESEGVDRIVSKLEVTGGREEPADSVQQAGGFSSQGQFRPASAVGPAPCRCSGVARRNPNGNMPVPYARTMQGNVQQANYPGGGGYCPPGGEMGGGMGGMGGGGPMAMGARLGAAGGQAFRTTIRRCRATPGRATPLTRTTRR